jgi:hypothetical protein
MKRLMFKRRSVNAAIEQHSNKIEEVIEDQKELSPAKFANVKRRK